MTALALRDDQDFWDDKQLAVLDQAGIATNVTNAELAAFLHVCQRTGLDPFARQIYLIGRWDAKAQREVFRPQTGIDGYRIVAQRTCERTRQTLGYEDTLWCGTDGKWTDVWLAAEPPAAAKVTVLRAGERFPAIATWSEYVPLNKKGEVAGMWAKMPAGQLAKCAESLALRKAFPNDMAGVYTAEEMEQADSREPVQPHNGNGHQPAKADSIPPDEHWHAHPAPEDGDPEWDAKVAQMSTFATDSEGNKLWAAIVAARKAGKITPAEDKRLKEIIKARGRELAEKAKIAEATEDEPVEGTVVPELDPEDSWTAAVEAIQSADDAVALASEVAKAMQDGEVDDDKGAALLAAIGAREASLAGAS